MTQVCGARSEIRGELRCFNVIAGALSGSPLESLHIICRLLEPLCTADWGDLPYVVLLSFLTV